MNNDIEKSKKAVQDLIKQKYSPQEWEAEQEAKQKHLAETLAFVDGVLAAYNQRKEEEAKQEDLKKSKILFKTDPLHPRGWTKN
ncbi:hypothetical protein ACOQNP_06080 [Ectopseudomonas khazarica]|uniref:hypothetical protein n=1 Tax=Ectopseudomonas khazarica TaxID=2502979 RepID=UPI003B93AB43